VVVELPFDCGTVAPAESEKYSMARALLALESDDGRFNSPFRKLEADGNPLLLEQYFTFHHTDWEFASRIASSFSL
jgi:hypothetical protein